MIGPQLGPYRITVPLGPDRMGEVRTFTIGWQSVILDEGGDASSPSTASFT